MTDRDAALIDNTDELLRFLKSRTQVFHLSNIFFRDMHYGIQAFALAKGRRLSFGAAEELAGILIRKLEEGGILRPIKPGSWMLNYPEFKKESTKPVPASTPAVPVRTVSSAAAPRVVPSESVAAS
ncbi:MAG TPA: hypothetical protein VMH23_19870 [Bacteroidota bacterium]|nr:hypothetical protein [Bacteroidota bacterium]